ncbi:DUF7504 family protein [Halorussus marinus]|uniref:DUF7504 family protein n=1 Tax=Halorussus marinus TaxID=2505976 RepID=UPI00109217D7|nr:hypothetical protein [Halorussus marinus]
MADAPDGAVGPGTNHLVLSDRMNPERVRLCYRLLTAPSVDPSEINVIQVSYTKSAEDIVAEWREHVGTLPANLYVVATQSSRGLNDESPVEENVTVVTAHPNDLTGLAMRLRDIVKEGLSDDRPLTVGFDSLTPLLEYNDVQSTYKFLHMFTGRLAEVNAVTHFHLDPNAFEDKTVHKLKTLVDQIHSLEE